MQTTRQFQVPRFGTHVDDGSPAFLLDHFEGREQFIATRRSVLGGGHTEDVTQKITAVDAYERRLIGDQHAPIR